jgi:uncharacterized protein (TIGR03083 family)
MDVSRERMARLYEQTVSSLDELFGQLKPEDWDSPTDCPAWSVRDILAHLGSFEAIAAGMAPHASDTDVSHLSYATGFNEPIERDVEARRLRPIEDLVAEFRDATLKRSEELRGATDEHYETSQITLPFGPGSEKDFMPIRIFDLYLHEQDIRRATSNPGHLDGEVAAFCFERMRINLPSIIGKRVKPSAGSSIVINLTSHAGQTLAFATGQDGRVAVTDTVGETPTVRVTLDLEAFLMLTGARRPVDELLATGRVTLHGDVDLGKQVLEALAVTP